MSTKTSIGNPPAMTRKAYPSDLTNDEWRILEIKYNSLITSKRGRPRAVPLREIFNALRYISRSGCQWRMLPNDLPDWRNVYDHYRRWIDNGLLIALNDALRCDLRILESRDAEPSAGIIDSQSVKSAEYAYEASYDAGKKIKGIKRHIIVDVMGSILGVIALSAGIQDRDGAKLLLMEFKAKFPKISLIWVDGGYTGKLLEWAKYNFNVTFEVVKRIVGDKFQVLRRRWVVERTFGWLMHFRRLCRNYERLDATAEGFVYFASINLILARMADTKKGKINAFGPRIPCKKTTN
jgi:putative transposase